MKTKKILSLVLAMVMVLAMAAPAFADDDDTPKNTVVISGGYAETDIAVTVPGNLTAVINPYGLGITVEDSEGNKTPITGQIVSNPSAITNESALNLNVGATVTGEIPLAAGVTSTNALKFSTTTTQGVGDDPDAEDYVAPLTTKSAYVNLEVVQAPASVVGDDASELEPLIIEAAAKDATWTGASRVNVSTKAVTVDGLAVLKAATMDADDGSFTSYAAGSAVLFRLTGDCVVSPKVAWQTTDTFKVTVAFTFSPVAA